MDDTIIIIGGGMAGIACARALAEAGQGVRVLDKGRGIGGRMATRRASVRGRDLSFDHGAQYIRPRDAAFREALEQAGARVWPDGGDCGRYVGVPGMSSVVRALAEGLEVEQQAEVTALAWQGGAWDVRTAAGSTRARRVVLSIPAPQVAALLGPGHRFVPELARVAMDPCLTLMAAFPEQGPRPFTHRLDPAHDLPWIAQNSSKPGRGAADTAWLAQAGPAFSRAHLEASAEEIEAKMLPLLADVLGVDPAQAVFARAHRWRFAQARVPLGTPFLYDSDRQLYAGGDWCLGARAEDAWQSGRAMARDILRRAGGVDAR